MTPKIERVTECVTLGEGPHWNSDNETLYFVDVYGHYLVRFTPSTNKFAKAPVGDHVKASFIIPVEGKKDHFVISLNNHLHIIKWDGESDKFAFHDNIHKFEEVSGTCDSVRINDAKCDCNGRLWAGTIGIYDGPLESFPPAGILHSIGHDCEVKCHTKDVLISNGMAWNNELGKMYYIDSLKGIIEYDWDKETGCLKNERTFFTMEKHKDISGVPDGMTIDTDGNLWIALFCGSAVIKIDGKTPETLLETIELPAVQVTSLTWGGKHCDELYVTTGAIDINGVKPEPPENGAVYRITDTGCRGFPDVKYKLQSLKDNVQCCC